MLCTWFHLYLPSDAWGFCMTLDGRVSPLIYSTPLPAASETLLEKGKKSLGQWMGSPFGDDLIQICRHLSPHGIHHHMHLLLHLLLLFRRGSWYPPDSPFYWGRCFLLSLPSTRRHLARCIGLARSFGLAITLAPSCAARVALLLQLGFAPVFPGRWKDFLFSG